MTTWRASSSVTSSSRHGTSGCARSIATRHRACPSRIVPSVVDDQRLADRPSLLAHAPPPCCSERPAQLLVDRMRAQRRGGAIDQSSLRRAIMTLGCVGNGVTPSTPRRPGVHRPAGWRDWLGVALSAWSWLDLLPTRKRSSGACRATPVSQAFTSASTEVDHARQWPLPCLRPPAPRPRLCGGTTSNVGHTLLG